MVALLSEESFAFIEGRIRHCGNTTPLFTKNALELIHQASGGIMRDISMIARSGGGRIRRESQNNKSEAYTCPQSSQHQYSIHWFL